MRILAIDTATGCAGAAVIDEKGIIAQFSLNVGLTHSQRFLPMLESLLQQAELPISKMDAIAVTVGPGSFTGIRIGVASAKAFAQGLGLPLIPVITLDAFAAVSGSGIVCPILDARKNEVYTALYADGKQIEAPKAVAPAELAAKLAEMNKPITICGDALSVYKEIFVEALAENFCPVAEHLRILPAIGAAILAKEQFLCGKTVTAAAIEPFYLRVSEAEAKLAAKKL